MCLGSSITVPSLVEHGLRVTLGGEKVEFFVCVFITLVCAFVMLLNDRVFAYCFAMKPLEYTLSLKK